MTLVEIGTFLWGFLTPQTIIVFVITSTAWYLFKVYSGASEKYLGDKYTDQRRQGEKDTSRLKLFETMYTEMKDFLEPLRIHLQKYPHVRKLMYTRCSRELFIMDPTNENVYETTDPDQSGIVDQWITRLVDNDFLDWWEDGTNTPKIIIKDELVSLLGTIS